MSRIEKSRRLTWEQWSCLHAHTMSVSTINDEKLDDWNQCHHCLLWWWEREP